MQKFYLVNKVTREYTILELEKGDQWEFIIRSLNDDMELLPFTQEHTDKIAASGLILRGSNKPDK